MDSGCRIEVTSPRGRAVALVTLFAWGFAGCGGDVSAGTVLPVAALEPGATTEAAPSEVMGGASEEPQPDPPAPLQPVDAVEPVDAFDPRGASLSPGRAPYAPAPVSTAAAYTDLITHCAAGRASLRFYDNVADPADAPAWREAVRGYYRCVLGLDEHHAAPLDLRVEETRAVSARVQRVRVTYAAGEIVNGQALRIPAYLFVPSAPAPVPAVVVYHGHGPGKVNVAEGEGTAENALGRYLAERYGYVVLAPDARTFGEFAIPGQDHAAYHRALHADPTTYYMGRLARDGYQDMALLAALPAVDHARVGVAGVSMGSWRALGHALLHDDVRAVAVSGLFVPFEFLFSSGHDACQHVTALAARLGMEDLGGALAPRGLMVQWGTHDWFYGDGAATTLSRARSMYRALGADASFVPDINPGVAHQFVNASVGAFLRARLGAGGWEP